MADEATNARLDALEADVDALLQHAGLKDGPAPDPAEQAKADALAKLTPEERAALGL